MVRSVRRGSSLRRVAREFRVSLRTVQRWVERAGSKRLDRVDWNDRPAGAPKPVNRTSIAIEQDVLRLRGELAKSDLGDSGADAIRRAGELLAKPFPVQPGDTNELPNELRILD